MLRISSKCILGCGLTLAVLIPLHAKSSETVLHTFTGGNDGAYPFAGLIVDTKGNFYSTTVSGGPYGSGTVFKLKPDGTESVLYSFTGESDGNQPQGGLIMDTKNNLYGTTSIGGTDDRGAVFKLTPKGKETVLYSFTGGSDGANPFAHLIMDTKGNLYGTAVGGGAGNNSGAVFKLAPDGTETVLYSFCLQQNCADGALPYAPLIADSNGNFYGTTVTGGNNNSGVVFKVTPKGKETVLYSFCAQQNCADGEGPLADLLMDSSGNLYGTTAKGGGAADDGTVFELAPDGTETVLYSFCTRKNCADGATPNASYLIMDGSGNLYSTTELGGKYSNGTVFELAPDGTETVLHAFAGGNDGANPDAGLIDKKGILYGTTFYGGADGYGTVFKIKQRQRCSQGGDVPKSPPAPRGSPAPSAGNCNS